MMSVKDKIQTALKIDGIALLPPMDVHDSIKLLKNENIHVECTMLDPWYNKGTGGVLPIEEYDKFIRSILNSSGDISDLLYLWGFPEIYNGPVNSDQY